jgi:D-glycero-D-manno-heptose 1,7-bisphosphate phosphatase
MVKGTIKFFARHPSPITHSTLRRAVFLDRDGVINRCEVRDGKPYAPRRLNDFRLLPGATSAVHALKQAGLIVIVVTNQPDIGNGLVEAATVEAMHEKLRRRLPVDAIMTCPHRQNAGCACRKPKPGMLIEAAKKWHIDLE